MTFMESLSFRIFCTCPSHGKVGRSIVGDPWCASLSSLVHNVSCNRHELEILQVLHVHTILVKISSMRPRLL